MLGDMRRSENRASYVQMLGVSPHVLVTAEQVHGNVVKKAIRASKTPLSLADGIVLDISDNNSAGIALGIVVADCAPLLFFDKKERSIGAAHAGWKGSYKSIATNVVDYMLSLGSNPDDIMVSIGPHIGMCCYSVPKDRVDMFFSMYGNDAHIASYIDGVWHMDIGYINWLQLRSKGIPAENIDVPPTCTSCQSDLFYSYRKDTKEAFGEIMGVIAYKF